MKNSICDPLEKASQAEKTSWGWLVLSFMELKRTKT